MNNELERVQMDIVIVECMLLPWHLSGRTGVNHKKAQSG